VRGSVGGWALSGRLEGPATWSSCSASGRAHFRLGLVASVPKLGSGISVDIETFVLVLELAFFMTMGSGVATIGISSINDFLSVTMVTIDCSVCGTIGFSRVVSIVA
jgi:hypothetical protein